MAKQAEAGAVGATWWNDEGFIFTVGYGQPVSDSSVRKQFHRLLQAAGIPHIRLHGLRDSYATIQLIMGTPLKVVQEQLGHSSISMTADRYMQYVPSLGRAAADAMDRALAQP